MKRLYKIVALVSFMLISAFQVFGQDNPEMADVMRSEGKIYVVIGIIMIILLGLFAYLFFLDRKIGRLERLLRDKNH